MIKENKNPAKQENYEKTKQALLALFNSNNEVDEQEEEQTKPIDEVSKKWNMNDRITNLFGDKIEKDTKLKGTYAKVLIGILIFQLIVLDTFFVLKGLSILNVGDVTFNIFISGGIAEIFVLVKIIVKYLFNDNLTELLKIILRANNSSNEKNNKKRENIITKYKKD